MSSNFQNHTQSERFGAVPAWGSSRTGGVQLAEFRLFVTDVESASKWISVGQSQKEQRRVRQRLEAAIMKCLYAAPAPFCDVPDKNMFLSSGWKNERPITVLNVCASKLYGLPERLPI